MKKNEILVILLRVVLMQNVENAMELVHAYVYQNTLEILTPDADLSALRTQTVLETKLALTINAKTLVLELVESTRNALYPIMLLLAIACLDT